MAFKQLSATLLAEVNATKIYNLGAEYIEEGTAGASDKLFKYIEYYGTTITTAGTYSIVVPHAETALSPVKYSSDKVNMVVDAVGRYTGVAIGALTSTNKYGFIQVKGPSHIRDSMPAGGVTVGAEIASTAAGTDKTIEPVAVAATTNAVGKFGIATSAATGTTTVLNILLYGE